MKLKCNIKIYYHNVKDACNILNSIEIDNLNFVKSNIKDKTLLTYIESNSITSLIQTLNDYLSCLSIAEKIIKKKW